MIKYDGYRTEVQVYMNTIQTNLIKDYGQFNEDWTAQLQLLADNYELFLNCRDSIKKDGMTVRGKDGSVQKHPLLVPYFNAEAYMIKILHSFAASPMSKSKMKLPAVDNEESFLDTI